MKILFLSSGKKHNRPGPIIKAQADSIMGKGIDIVHRTVNQKGLKGYIKECFLLRKFLQGNDFDIIHAHYGLSAIVGLIARRKEKLITSFMGSDLISTDYYDGNHKVIVNALGLINILFSRLFYDFSIVKSEEMAVRLKTKKRIIIPNGVNINSFKPLTKYIARKNLGLNEITQLVIFVSNPDRPEKNFSLAQQAVVLIQDERVQLVSLSGIDQAQLVHYYNAADVMVLSSFHEGSPNVIKEAMACNCPIVTTDVGDVKWVMGDTEGCFVAAFDPEHFAERLKMALAFSENHGRTNGRKRLKELGLESGNIADRIIRIYERVLVAGSDKSIWGS